MTSTSILGNTSAHITAKKLKFQLSSAPGWRHHGDGGGCLLTCWLISGTFSSRLESRLCTTNILVTVELLLPSLQTEDLCEDLDLDLDLQQLSHIQAVVDLHLVTATARTATRPAGSRMGLLYFLPLTAELLWSASGLDPSRV